jgi:hypothetical protein
MHSPTKKILIGAMASSLALTLTAHPAFAGGGTGDSSTPTANPTQTTPDTTTPSSSTPSQPVAPLQVNQQSISWSSSLTPPSCNGGCFFAVTRVAPATYGSGTNLEAIVGVTIPISSNDGGVGEINRLNAETQKHKNEYDMKLVLSEKLAEALESGKMERAKIIAMNLAPLMGYKDYQLLLNNFATPTAAKNSNILGFNPTYVSVSVMF